jgi:hypothetical protein
MSNSSELNSYIARLHRRLRIGTGLRGAAIFTATSLLTTVVLVYLLNRFAFPALGVTAARVALIATLASAAAFGIALPLTRLTRAWTVRRAESVNPGLEQRLTTFVERASSGSDPFLELLAADTLAHTSKSAPSELVSPKHLYALGSAGITCLTVLVWMIVAGPGYIGYGASLLWTGVKKNVAPLYGITVKPGNLTVRRNSDQLITAQVSGMAPNKAQLFAHFQSSTGWEPVTMQSAPDAGGGATYRFIFAGLPESVEYYVKAGPLVSPHYKLHVVDLPTVKQVSVTYRYPAWTGMKPVTERHSGDLRAIEGTDAAIEIQMDHPLIDGQLTLDTGQSVLLTGGKDNVYRASIHMEKDGAYHVAAIDAGQPVRLSEDYFIATDKALPPRVSIDRPAGDYRASPIEEVTIGVNAADQFGLREMDLHYSVNGGPNQTVSLLKAPGANSSEGKYVLLLENFNVAPGDLVSVYATARDGHSTGRTDITFVQVDPFEREFSQSQQMAGGGGDGSGGSNQMEISRREKELIAATWKQENDKGATPKDAAAQGQFLSDAQQKLRDQVMALSIRTQSRDISSTNGEFGDFDKDMQMAAAAMTPSAINLKNMKWKEAIPLEQKALQALLHAEATFRRIEVAFGQSGGGGGGGGNAGRDLASLFDLELDMEKNQYETARTASPAEQHEKDVEDALEKLDALAKRQEDLANQQHDSQQNFQQRWQQEMLRREAEQLQRQMEQLARNGQQDTNGPPSAQQDGQQSSSTQSGLQGHSGSQSSQSENGSEGGSSSSSQSADQSVEQALSRLRQATGEMQRDGTAGQNAEAAREAAERLREATNMLASSQHKLATNSLDSMAREASRLAQEERAQSQSINQLASQQNDSSSADGNFSSSYLDNMMARIHQRDQLAEQRQHLSNDLSRLQQSMRDTARTMAPNEPDVAGKLRDALTEMDQSDLDNHVQRTADWLRSGVNPNSNGTESEIAHGLQNLSRRLQDAEQAMSREKPVQPGVGKADETEALDQVERLRSWIAGMGQQDKSGQRDRNGSNQAEQNGQRGSQPGGNGNQLGNSNPQLSRNGPQGDQSGALSRFGAAHGQQRGGAFRNGDVGGPVGDTRYGRGASGTVYGNIDTGNNTYGRPRQQPAAPANSSGNPADTERTFEQNMNGLTQLRQMVQGDPQTAKDVAELTRLMQHLDPRRFPGNPAEVEQMHQELLNTVGRLELQLQRDGISSDARTGKPYDVPAGYKDAVAEYYKRLSKNP